MNRIQKIGLGLLLGFLALQFIHPARNESAALSGTDITHVTTVPKNVASIIKAACYDCHSNNTHYPWYTHVQPTAWFMARHIQKGKRELNFSDFGAYSKRKQAGKFKAIASQVLADEMPLSSYRLLHARARLSTEQKNIIITWAEQSRDSIVKQD